MDYHYGNKKQWRRWVWNRLVERTKNRGEGLVLFLAGRDAHDLEEAQRRGFRTRNMLAVEQDGSTLKGLRDDGVLAINGDLCEVLLNWPKGKPVEVVLADFCCGLEMRLVETFARLDIHPAFADTVFAVNVLRGRDASTNALRQSGGGVHGVEEKHRGAHLYAALATHWVSGGTENLAVEEAESVIRRRLPGLEGITEPAFHSYRSTAGNQVFDTVVWRSPFGEFARRSQKVQAALEMALKLKHRAAGAEQRRRTAAVLAHHTRRVAA